MNAGRQKSSWRMSWIRERSETTQASSCREHEAPAHHGMDAALLLFLLLQPVWSCILSSSPPSLGHLHLLPREEQAEMRSGGDASYPGEEGRGGKNNARKAGKESTPPRGRLCSPGVMARALLLANGTSASHRSPACADTRHLRQRRAPALGWPAAGLVSHRGRF